MAPSARLFTIPASAPFLPTLIRSLVAGKLVPGFPASRDPLALAAATIYLPTRRACRLARELFLDALEQDAAVLPRIVPIGDVDEDELVFADAAAGAVAETALELPPALTTLERKLLLAKLVLEWSTSPRLRGSGGAPLVAHSPAAALALAEDLARLIDDMTTRGIPWHRLDDLVPEEHDEYWQLTLEFLKIARDKWPSVLAARGVIEAATRRDLLIAAEAARLAAATDRPVIAAGSTGSMQATATLLSAIARLSHGAVVLPGLDTDLDADAWDAIGGSSKGRDPSVPAAAHPQFAMRALLQRLGVGRDAVITLGDGVAPGRTRLVSEALRPAAATERWKQRLEEETISAALADIAMIEAANAEEEALAIAVALREAADVPGKRAALVTPDRALARRVVAALERWGMTADDSGGEKLVDTHAGIFARLVADAALGGLAPIRLLAMLKHPLLRLGSGEHDYAGAIAVLEKAILRGPRPRRGSSGLAHALSTLRRERHRLHPSDPRAGISDSECDSASDLISRLAAALAPLETLGAATHPLAELAARHRDVVAALAAGDHGDCAAFAGEDGTALAAAFEDIVARLPGEDIAIAPADYPSLFGVAIADRVVRKPAPAGAQVHIFGLLEARLQPLDRVVLGGLVEGTWPPETRVDPWLSRPMRHVLGLDLPERRIGLSAHDFAQALGAPEVVLARAAKLAGAPTVTSRFVQRLAAVAGPHQWETVVARGDRYLAYARLLDRPDEVRPVRAPQPRPPRIARPNRLSVTDVEHWLRDPYTIYAKHVLRLVRWDDIDMPPGARDRGNVIHAAIAEFTETFAERLPAEPLREVVRLGTKHFAALEDFPEARAFWWPRFLRIADWLVNWEVSRRAMVTDIQAETRGEIEIPLGERTFRLAARADRVERRADGRYAIADYKTGQARSDKQVRTGLAPQLTLEAAILRRGGFPGIAAEASVAELAYVVLKGGEPAGIEKVIAFEAGSPDEHADRALSRFTAMAARFEDETEPFRSLVHPMWKYRYGDYDHLARVKEWSATGGLSDPVTE